MNVATKARIAITQLEALLNDLHLIAIFAKEKGNYRHAEEKLVRWKERAISTISEW